MEPVDFAGWLRENPDGPHDMLKRVWGDREVPDIMSRPEKTKLSGILRAIIDANPSETEWKLIKVVAANPGAKAAVLTGEMGWSGTAGWQLHFGGFCRRLEAALGDAPTTTDRTGKDGGPARFYSGLLVDFDDASRGFTLKPAVVQALRDAGEI
jgi:hypothetical protein